MVEIDAAEKYCAKREKNEAESPRSGEKKRCTIHGMTVTRCSLQDFDVTRHAQKAGVLAAGGAMRCFMQSWLLALMQIAGHDHRSTLTEGSRVSYYFTHFEY